jgi:TPR repeat protein
MRGSTLVLAVLLSLAFAPGFGNSARADPYERAAHYIERGKPAKAVRQLERGVLRDDARCQFVLGMWMLSGTQVERDLEEGTQLLGKAAAQDLPIAQSYMGVLYSSGLGVESDSREAAEWFQKAALYGEPLGQAGLGIASYLGDGVPQDRIEAYKWISLSASQGNERSVAHLATLEQQLSGEEIQEGKSRAAAFQPKALPSASTVKLDFKLFDGRSHLRRSTGGGAVNR